MDFDGTNESINPSDTDSLIPQESTSNHASPDENKEDSGKWHGTINIGRRITVEPIMILYFCAFAPSVPLNEQFMYEQISERHNFTLLHNTSSQCDIDVNSTEFRQQQLVQSEASHWMTYLNIAGLIPELMVIILLGPYSDKAGRKIAMYLPIIGAILRLLVTLLVIALKLPLETLLLGAFLEGLSGGIVAIIMACFAYIADITSLDKRAIRIFLLEVMIGVGIVISNVGMGYAIKALGYFYPYLILLCFHVANLAYTYFLVKESIPRQSGARFFSTSHLQKMMSLFGKDDGTNRRWKLQALMLVLFLAAAIDNGNMDINSYKMLKTPLCFTSVLIGYYVAVNYSCKMILGAITVKLLLRHIYDVGLIVLSLASSAGYSILFAFADTRLWVFLCPLMAFGSQLAVPMIRSFTSKIVQPSEQGTLMAGIAWIQSMSAIIGNVSLNQIYAATVNIYTKFAFFVAAGFYLIGLVITLFVLIDLIKNIKKKNLSKPEPENA